MKYQLHTFGCKVNTYDSGLIQRNLEKNGYGVSKEAGIHVLNTCAVTGEATKEAVKLVRKIKSQDPLALVIVTGCAAQVDTGSFESLPGVDLIVANSHKGFLPQIIDQHYKGTLSGKVFKSNIFRKEDLEFGGGEESSHTRSFLKIQDGCNQFCSYCIIPYARGKSRSISIKDLAARVNELSLRGVQEVVLTGVHIGDYEDQGRSLEDLVEALLAKTTMSRFRLSSLEPIEVSDRLLDLYQDPRMCAHFHMSIQSANDRVLKDMKRKYGQKEVKESLQRIREKVPSAFVGMDVIVGFPTETDEDFEDTYKTLMDSPWSRIHVFPYSERQGTKAAVMSETVRREVRLERAGQLRSLSLQRYQAEGLAQVGQVKKALVLKKQSKGAQALSRDFWPIAFANHEEIESLTANQEVAVKIESFFMNDQRMDGVLQGRLHV